MLLHFRGQVHENIIHHIKNPFLSKFSTGGSNQLFLSTSLYCESFKKHFKKECFHFFNGLHLTSFLLTNINLFLPKSPEVKEITET